MFFTRLFQSSRNRGLLLCIIGFVTIVLSSTLAPLYAPRVCSQYWCASAFSSSAVVVIQRLFQGPAAFTPGTLALALPLIMPILMVTMGISYMIYPHRVLLWWLIGEWITGFIPFIMLTLISMIYYFPSFGFFGIVTGYIFFFAGYRSLLSMGIKA